MPVPLTSAFFGLALILVLVNADASAVVAGALGLANQLVVTVSALLVERPTDVGE